MVSERYQAFQEHEIIRLSQPPKTYRVDQLGWDRVGSDLPPPNPAWLVAKVAQYFDRDAKMLEGLKKWGYFPASAAFYRGTVRIQVKMMSAGWTPMKVTESLEPQNNAATICSIHEKRTQTPRMRVYIKKMTEAISLHFAELVAEIPTAISEDRAAFTLSQLEYVKKISEDAANLLSEEMVSATVSSISHLPASKEITDVILEFIGDDGISALALPAEVGNMLHKGFLAAMLKQSDEYLPKLEELWQKWVKLVTERIQGHYNSVHPLRTLLRMPMDEPATPVWLHPKYRPDYVTTRLKKELEALGYAHPDLAQSDDEGQWFLSVRGSLE